MTKIGFTTSRSPAKKTRSFIHDIVGIVPYSSRFSRGSATLTYSINSMKNKGFETAVIVNSVKGNPNFMRIFDLISEPKELPYAIKIRGLTLSREYLKSKKGSRPHFAVLISSLANTIEEEAIRRVFGVSIVDVENLKNKDYVTLYADYLDKDEGLIFLEFLDNKNLQVGPRMKIRVVPRSIEDTS